MKFNDWFLIDTNRVRAPDLAAHFDVTTPAVHQWAAKGVPVGRMADVERFTCKVVRIADMVRESAELRKARLLAKVKS